MRVRRVGRARPQLARGWTVWPQFQVRGTGLPLALLEPLSSPTLAQASAAWLVAQHQQQVATSGAIQAVEQEALAAAGPARVHLHAVLRALRKTTPLPDQLPAAAATVAGFRTQQQRCRAALEQAWTDESARIRAALRGVAANPTFQEAIAWQNRNALHLAVRALLQLPAHAADARTRKKELAVVSYAQRYCAKNDTIGFFGPIGWGSWNTSLQHAHVHAGPGMWTWHQVRFEPWAVQAIASAFEGRQALRMNARPALKPHLWLADGHLHGLRDRSLDGARPLSAVQQRVLSLCTGRTPVTRLVQRLGRSTDVLGVLIEMESAGIITWCMDVAAAPFPERHLATTLARLPDGEVKTAAQTALGHVVELRTTLAAATGDVDAVDDAMARLEAAFEEETAKPALRHPGQTYAGRTLVHLDCRRDVRVALGADILKRVAGPLAPVLLSARWYTHQVANAYHQHFDAVLQRLARRGARVNFARFLAAVEESLEDASPPLFAQTTARLQQRWARLLNAAPAEQRVFRESKALWRAAARVFAAPAPGWPSARHHCPDILVGAASVEALARGHSTLVLGELHAGLCVFNTISATQSHPRVRELMRLYQQDVPAGVAPVPVDSFARSSQDSRLRPEDFHIETRAHVRSWKPASRVMRAADLVVFRHGRNWRVTRSDGGGAWDLMVLMDRPLRVRAAVYFKMLADAPHLPRIMLDDLCIQRESWQEQAPALSFAGAPTPLERFVAVQAWRRRLALPQHVFVRVPKEIKPVYIDLESPALVELLCHHCRGAQQAGISEMLPTPDQLWLHDARGQRYTSEFRMVAVDPLRWQRGPSRTRRTP